MKQDKRVVIVGGDNRQKLLYEVMKKDFVNTKYVCTDKDKSFISEADIVIFPIPVSKDKKLIYSDNPKLIFKAEEALKCISKNAVVFGGNFSLKEKEFFEEESIEYHDFLLNELFLMENAYLTAEGALRLLLENTEETLFNKSVLVTGYGRISEILSVLLERLNMKVTVAARNEVQLKHAEKNGCTPLFLNRLKDILTYDFIFNTVPVRIFDENVISTTKNTVYFELASSPYGADKTQIILKGIKYVDGGSLPGKFFPLSSANLIKDYILKYV